MALGGMRTKGEGGSPRRGWASWTSRSESSLLAPSFSVFFQEAHLLPQLGGHPHLQDLLLLQGPPHPLVPPQGSQLQGTEQGEARPLHPLSPQHKAPVVGEQGPPALQQPLLEPNSGKSAR